MKAIDACPGISPIDFQPESYCFILHLLSAFHSRYMTTVFPFSDAITGSIMYSLLSAAIPISTIPDDVYLYVYSLELFVSVYARQIP